MRKFSYWLCFSLVALPATLGLLGWLFALVGVALPGLRFFYLFSSFGSLVPPVLLHVLPQFVSVVLGCILLALVLRRVWLQFKKHEGVPLTYAGVPKVLGYMGAWSLIVGVVVLALSVALRAGSGVPAGMLMLPAMFCVPWAFFLTEVLSLRRVSRSDA
jgi:hypothetical protein